jgi:imidazole glycerol-phosphate synthase subunit HisH
MTVAIIDYGSGNLRSAAKAFEHVGGHDVLVTARAEDVLAADRVVLPGVGAFGDCRRGLLALDGMLDALEEAVIRNGRPFLGICVGMQLMATRGLEHGSQDGFGWIDGDVVAIAPDDPTLKIPHMGWNNLSSDSDHALLAGLGPEPHMYFVHSYHLAAKQSGQVLATADYGGAITAIVGRDNIVGTQFHPEKSQALGLRLIENFLNWNP